MYNGSTFGLYLPIGDAELLVSFQLMVTRMGFKYSVEIK